MDYRRLSVADDRSEEKKKRDLIDGLFLSSCVASMIGILKDFRIPGCIGCRVKSVNERSHTCQDRLEISDTIAQRDHFNQCVPILSRKVDEVLSEMYTIVKRDLVFSEFTMGDFLEFYCRPGQISPFIRLCTDEKWKEILYNKIVLYV